MAQYGSEYDQMRKDGYEHSSHDPQIVKNPGKEDLLVHPNDPNFVKKVNNNGSSWERYDSDKHNK